LLHPRCRAGGPSCTIVGSDFGTINCRKEWKMRADHVVAHLLVFWSSDLGPINCRGDGGDKNARDALMYALASPLICARLQRFALQHCSCVSDSIERVLSLDPRRNRQARQRAFLSQLAARPDADPLRS
jgi:hypothetical protein